MDNFIYQMFMLFIRQFVNLFKVSVFIEHTQNK